MTDTAYEDFVATKLAITPPTGFEPPGGDYSWLFRFQDALTRWAIRRGRSAIFAGTGLGKSRMGAAWAHAVLQHTQAPVLVLTPLAVAAQWAAEAVSVGINARVCRTGDDVDPSAINVTNYDRIGKFDTSVFKGVVWDEASVAKEWTTATFGELRDRFKDTPFRLSETATPAPNDYMELGTQAELLGICKRTEMLSEFFVHDGGETSVWRLKGHAQKQFWRWVASWAALVTHPRDLGPEFDQKGYDLPPLDIEERIIKSEGAAQAAGLLFAEEARTLQDQRAARRGSLNDRVSAAVEQVMAEDQEPFLVWCDLNAESEALAAAIPDSVEVRGAMSIDEKEDAIASFVARRKRVLVTKPSICAHGLNLQFCARQAFVGVTHSFEQYFQALRRSWRFGQTRRVKAYLFVSELEGGVLANLRRKEKDAEEMSRALALETRDAVRESVIGQARTTVAYEPTVEMVVPEWVRSES